MSKEVQGVGREVVGQGPRGLDRVGEALRASKGRVSMAQGNGFGVFFFDVERTRCSKRLHENEVVERKR